MLVFLLLVARWIVLRHQRRASSAAEMLLALTPSRARRVDGDRVVELPIDAIEYGDLLEVLAGDTIPVDGRVERGASTLDRGLLTGESRPQEVAPGDAVHAGTVNLAAPLRIRATAIGEDTRLGVLVGRIAALATRRAPIERFVDRVAGRFVVVVTAVAALTFAAWATVSLPLGMERAMALLVVTCPCALALATPLAVAIGLGRAARRGILIKGADALERMATPGTLFVDKTGTLTEGSLAVVGWHGDDHAARLAATLEAASRHPIAAALARHAQPVGLAVDPREELGRGIVGVVDGHRVIVGAPAWVFATTTHDAVIDDAVARCAAEVTTPVVVAVDGVAVAVAALADPLRAGARDALAALVALGWRVELLSGDDPRVVTSVGARLGIPAARCSGSVTPEGKLAAVTAARARGPVAMLGDGVNDAAAIAAATCGIAVSGAAEIAVEAADVYLRDTAMARDGIAAVVAVATGARETLRTIRRSLRMSLAYNVAAGTLAVAGVIHPLIAALAMPVSSLAVLASSLRSHAFRGGA
jgi:Cu2+-exporting ATPase